MNAQPNTRPRSTANRSTANRSTGLPMLFALLLLLGTSACSDSVMGPDLGAEMLTVQPTPEAPLAFERSAEIVDRNGDYTQKDAAGLDELPPHVLPPAPLPPAPASTVPPKYDTDDPQLKPFALPRSAADAGTEDAAPHRRNDDRPEREES